MNSTQRIYPGMCDGNLEIFYHKVENKLKVIHQNKVQDFDDTPNEILNFLGNILQKEDTTKNILNSWYPNDTSSQIRKLAQCRFGGLDFEPDYCNGTNNCNGDFIECPNRNLCKGNGIVCNPIGYQNTPLSLTDIKAIKLISSVDKNEVIAQEMNMPIGSFNVYRTNLYKKLNIQTKQEATRVGVYLGIV